MGRKSKRNLSERNKGKKEEQRKKDVRKREIRRNGGMGERGEEVQIQHVEDRAPIFGGACFRFELAV